MPFKAPVTEKCTTCTKSVYAAERMEAGGNIYHKLCFKCVECQLKLQLSNYSQDQGRLYCKQHFQKCVTSQNTQVVM